MSELDAINPSNPRPESHLHSAGYALRLYPIDEAEEIRLVELWRVMWDGRWLILCLAALGALAAVIAAFVITPVYRAEVVIAPVTAEPSGGGLAALAGELGGIAALAGVNLGTDASIAESIAILRSRAFTEQFIEKNNLMPVLYPEAWDQANATWNVADPSDTPTAWRAYELFDRSIRSVAQDAETGLVTLTIDWVDPKVAADWANGLVKEVNANVRNRAIEQSTRSIDFLRDQLQVTTELELRAAVFGLMEAEMKNAMLANVRTEFAFEVIDPAVVPEKRHWPKRTLLAVLGASSGLLLGVLSVFVRRSMRT